MSVTRKGRGDIAITVWYPSSSDNAVGAVGAVVADGTWPVVLFSHGLRGLPDDYAALLAMWAQAGFIVIAPTYPNTNRNAAHTNPGDVKNQPADASSALDTVLAAAMTSGDGFEHHVDASHIVAAGHSEGAITTVGLFDSCCRDKRLSGGVVLAGNSLGFPGAPSGPSVPMLFIHGDSDRLVPALGRKAYGEFAWPRAFVTLAGEGHIDPYVKADTASFTTVAGISTQFLNFVSGRIDLATFRQSLAVTDVSIDDHLS